MLALSELATKGELQVREDDPFVIELFLAGTNKLFDLESGANLDLIAAAVNFIRSDAFRLAGSFESMQVIIKGANTNGLKCDTAIFTASVESADALLVTLAGPEG